MNFGDIKKRIHLATDTNKGVLVEDWIRSGQKYLEDNLRIRAMEYFPTPTTINSGTSSIAVPADYILLISLNIIDQNTRYPLEDRLSVHEYNATINNIANTNTGRPTAFGRFGDTFKFDKYTDKEYKYEIGYYRRLTSLTSDANTNWWTTNAYEALFFASLVEGIPLLLREVSLTESAILAFQMVSSSWIKKRDEEKNKLKKADLFERFSGKQDSNTSINVF